MEDKEKELYLEYNRGWMDCFLSRSKYSDGTMMTPEDAFPEYEPGCVGFRMGLGEDYCIKYFEWLKTLSLDGRKNYDVSHPRKYK